MKPDEPAFPAVHDLHKETKGMPIRLWVATHCLQGLLAADWNLTPVEMASGALSYADALISEEQKPKS